MTKLHALLVGIDRYEPTRFSDGLPIRPLLGAVDDARRIESAIDAAMPAGRIGRVRTLVSPHVQGAEPVNELDLPTRDNLVREIRRLGEQAEAGDELFVHFSGHGARVRTLLPDVKGEGGWDECLVPADVGAHGVLRDVEVHALVSDLVERDLRVLVVLDACHSGGAFRGAGPESVDAGVRSLGSLESVLPRSEVSSFVKRRLARRWLDAVAATPRHLAGDAGWFPLPRGASLLAACAPHELARERHFEGFGYAGAMTRYLLEALAAAGPDITLAELHGRLLARLAGLQPRQTPVLEGERERTFWPGRRKRDRRDETGALVLRVDPGDPARMRLGVGWFHGVHSGARFAARHPGPAKGRSAHGAIEVVEAGATESWAEVEGGGRIPEPGSRVLLDEPGPLARRWRLAVPEIGGVTPIGRRLQEVRAALPRRTPVRVDLVPAGEPPDLTIGVTEDGGLEVLDGSGAALRHAPAPVSAHRDDAVDRLLERVDHVARYRQILALRSLAEASSLFGGLEVEIFRAPAGGLPVEAVDWEPLDGPVRCGERVHLVLTNETNDDLDLVVLALHSDWSVTRIHPPPGRAPWDSLERRSRTTASFVAYLPPAVPTSRDLLLIFGAAGPLDLSCHILPALGERGAVVTEDGGGGSGARFRAFGSTVVPPGSVPWVVASAEIEVVAPAGEQHPLRAADCVAACHSECRP